MEEVSSRSPMLLQRSFEALAFSLLVALVPASSVFASSALQTAEATPPSSKQNVAPAEVELRRRVEAAQTAKQNGDPASIAFANQRLIALALREMGQLRLRESAFPQSIELYQHSLDFEDRPDTRIDLAIAEFEANRLDDALSDSSRALAVDPEDTRALILQGRLWIKRQDYTKAAEAFEKAVRINPDLETYYSWGICLLQSNDSKDRDRAAGVFQQMEQLAGDSGSLHVLFGRAYRDANDMQNAIREFERAIALDTRTPHAHYFLGLARLAVNEWKATPEIKAEFLRELSYYPHDYLANYMLGFIASSERDYADSDKYLKTAAELNPEQPEPWLYMGLNANARDDAKRAEEMFRKAIQYTGKDESRSNFQIRRAYVDLGRILAKSGRTQESEVYLSKARDLQSKTLQEGQENLAMAFAGTGGAPAIVPLSKRSEADSSSLPVSGADLYSPLDSSSLARANFTDQQKAAASAQEARLRSILGLSFNDLGTSHAIRGEYLEALGNYQQAERWDASIPGLFKNLGLSAFRLQNYPEAIRGLSQALQQQRGDQPLRSMLGMAYFASENYPAAIQTFSPLGWQGMRDSSVGFAWATALARTNDLKAASNVLGEFEKNNQSVDQLLLIGQLWIEISDYGRAVDALHRALQTNPSLQKAHYFAGQADIRWEHWPEAAEEFQAELKLNPADSEARYNLGFVYIQESKVDEAAELFRQVISEDSNHANAQYQLGKILLDQGNLSEGVSHLETASRLSPQADYVHYQLQAAYRKQSRFAEADHELALYRELKAKQREHAALQSPQNR